MNQKKFYHQSVEICKICGKEIDTSKNEWAAVIDYNGKKQIRIGFYHRKCLNDLLKGKMEVMKQKFKEKLSQFTKDFFQGMKTSPEDYRKQLDDSLKKLVTT